MLHPGFTTSSFWQRMLTCIALGAVLCGVCACAQIRFERSPYAIRGFDVIYSEQEDMTFLIWRIRDSADPGLVDFELMREGNFEPLDLDAAPYPAQPYQCGTQYWCYQYQLDGDVQWAQGERPLRSIHVEEGIYAGSQPRYQRVRETFSINPIGIDNNATIDLDRFDWFDLNEVPFKRTYRWQLVASSRPDYRGGDPSTCEKPAGAGWSEATRRDGATVATPPAVWVDEPRCLYVSPSRRDGGEAPVLLDLITPSAQLYAERQDYVPPEERPPVIYAYLFDLLIKSEARCRQAREGIIGAVDRGFGERAPDSVRLGSFTPTDSATGRPLSGCDQRAEQDYPVRQIIDALKEEAGSRAPQQLRFVLVYVNNVELPPSPRILLQLQQFSRELDGVSNVSPYGLAIGSNVVSELIAWNYTIGWRPIDDETFIEDIEGWAEFVLPFRTTDHDLSTEVRIQRPVPAPQAERFKICSSTPDQLGSVGDMEGTFPRSLSSFPWPEFGEPHYTVGLAPQVLVPSGDYVRQEASVVVEVCARFCDLPYRSAAGINRDNWAMTEGCQWRQ